MTKFNDHDNLTHEATAEIERFIRNNFNSIDQDLLTRAAGECAFEEIEKIEAILH